MGNSLGITTATLLTGSVSVFILSSALASPLSAADPTVCSAKTCSFVSPNGTINCTITADAAACAWTDGDRAHSVKLMPNGALDPCINLGLGVGRTCPSFATNGPTLGYGQTAVMGPFTCLVEAQDITCMATPPGRGFSINSAGILPAVAPAPPPPAEPTPTAEPAPPVESPAPPPLPIEEVT